MYVRPMQLQGDVETDRFEGANIGEKTIDYSDNPNLI